jgi:putative NADH-flavin reductase
MKIKAIITGASGMVGEGVLHECLLHPDVQEVLVVGRRSAGVTHPKLKEILHSNFHDLSAIKDQLKGYNACYFCLGVSSIGMKEKEYHHLTYDLTMHMATILAQQNPDMTFCYVSGSGTDSTEHGILMLYPVLKPLFPNAVSTLREVGLAMIHVTIRGYDNPVLEVKDIIKLAHDS